MQFLGHIMQKEGLDTLKGAEAEKDSNTSRSQASAYVHVQVYYFGTIIYMCLKLTIHAFANKLSSVLIYVIVFVVNKSESESRDWKRKELDGDL